MSKDIKKYFQYYIDAVRFRYRYVDSEPGVWSVWVMMTHERFAKAVLDKSIAEVQIELRKLESMTEEELKWYFDSIKRMEDELDYFEWVTEQNGGPVDHPHWTMWCKDQTWARHGYVLGGSEERYEPKQFHYLLSRGFDLFGLIDAGLATDKSTIK